MKGDAASGWQLRGIQRPPNLGQLFMRGHLLQPEIHCNC